MAEIMSAEDFTEWAARAIVTGYRAMMDDYAGEYGSAALEVESALRSRDKTIVERCKMALNESSQCDKICTILDDVLRELGGDQ